MTSSEIYSLLAHTRERYLPQRSPLIGGPGTPRSLLYLVVFHRTWEPAVDYTDEGRAELPSRISRRKRTLISYVIYTYTPLTFLSYPNPLFCIYHSLASTPQCKTANCFEVTSRSTQLEVTTTTTPTPPFAFLLHMHNDVHASSFQELHSALAYIFHVGGARSDDVDHA
jgi:hypothetical protein